LWLVTWGILAFLWKGKDVDVKKAFRVGLILGVVGALLMFPPVFDLFKP
jgi:hypothetical protein